jgi:hypothetical protein
MMLAMSMISMNSSRPWLSSIRTVSSRKTFKGLPKEKQAALFKDLEALALKEGMDPDPNLLEGIPEQFNAKIFYPFHDIDKLSDFSQGEAKLAKSYGVLLHHTVMCQDMRDDVHVRVTDADPKLLTDTTDDGSANGQNKRG